MNRGRALGPGNLRKVGANWVLTWTDELRTRRRRVLGGDKRVAERRRSEIIARRDMALDGLGAVEGMSLPVPEVIEAYLHDLEPRVTSRHFGNVRSQLTRLVSKLGTLRVRDLTVPLVVRIRSEAVKQGAANRTANLVVDRLKAALNWAVESGLIDTNPIRNAKRLPETAEHQRYRRRALTEDEIQRFLEASREDDEENELVASGIQRVPQTPMWQALLETGARWNELRQITWGDVDLGRGVVVLRAENTKARKQRSIPLRDELVEVLISLRALHEAVLGRLSTVADRVFLSPEGVGWRRPTTNPMRIFHRVLDRAGIAKVGMDGRKLDIHGLRTTAASRLARNGVPLVQAQRILGHSDPKLTAQAYTDLAVEDLRGAVDSLPPTDHQAHKRAEEA